MRDQDRKPTDDLTHVNGIMCWCGPAMNGPVPIHNSIEIVVEQMIIGARP